MASEENQVTPILEPPAFRYRLAQEVARVRRSGGFVSLALFAAGRERRTAAKERLTGLGERLRRTVRLHDVLAWHEPGLALLMPGTPMPQAARAAERLLRVAQVEATDDEGDEISAGIATAYGEVEGGPEALIAAAAEALREADRGQVTRSKSLDGRPRILVVDDDPGFAEMLAETITARGWEGHPCSDHGDVLQRCAETSYSALFVDLMMPRISGVEVARRWLQARADRPVVLMSGAHAQGEAILEALSLGPVMFVGKPISEADLDTALAMFRQALPGARPTPRAPQFA